MLSNNAQKTLPFSHGSLLCFKVKDIFKNEDSCKEKETSMNPLFSLFCFFFFFFEFHNYIVRNISQSINDAKISATNFDHWYCLKNNKNNNLKW